MSGKELTLTLASAVRWHHAVTVAYTNPLGPPPLQDAEGYDVADFELTVENETPNPRARRLVFDPKRLEVPEDGSATYTVKLDRAPETGYPVHVRVAEMKTRDKDPDSVSISPSDFLLDGGNWNTGREVTVRAHRDGDGHAVEPDPKKEAGKVGQGEQHQ